MRTGVISDLGVCHAVTVVSGAYITHEFSFTNIIT